MGGCEDLLRRRFIAIATDRFEADGTFPSLDVASEVETLRAIFCSPALNERRFEHHFPVLSSCPSREDIHREIAGNRFGDADAVVLYLTGHGVTDKGRHRTVLADSDPQRLASTTLDTINLLEWLAEHPGLREVMVIIDLCNAGDVAFEITREMEAAIPHTWIALLTVPAGKDAKVGAFAGAVRQVVEDLAGGADRDATDIEPYLASHVFIARVREAMKSVHGQDLKILRDPYRTSCCLPNPKYDPAGGDRVHTTPARSDLAILEHDMTAHWRRRAPVAADPGAGLPWVFTGRDKLVRRLVDAATGSPATLVVTGRAGSGKSAVLARLVTCSDPIFRAEHAHLLASVHPLPPEGAVDVAVLATGKGPEQVVAQIAGALGVPVPASAASSLLDQWITGIQNAIASLATPPTVVIDALDESSDPVGVVGTVLQRLNPPGEPRIRLIVGVRSSSEDGGSFGRSPGLADITVEALGAAPVAVDADEFWEPADLRTFVAQALLQKPSPFAGHAEDAAAVAAEIEKRVGRSYLLAVLVAGELVNRKSRVAADDPELSRLLAGGVAEVVRQDLAASLPDSAERERAVLLLRAAALSFGRGIPWREVWPVVASAIAPDGRVMGDADVEWLLHHHMSGYLVRDLEDDVTVYRLFHDALRESLARDAGRYLPDRAGSLEHDEAHRRIARALLPRFDRHGDRPPPSYSRRHLVEHAAVAGELDEPFLTAQTLPLLDAYSLSRSLRLVQADPHSPLGLLLAAWRGVRHRWSWDRPEANAVALDVALVAAGSAPPERPIRTSIGWKTRWAEWSFGGTVVGIEDVGLRSIALGAVAGRPCLVTGNATDVHVWDAATSELLGPPVPAGNARAVALVAERGGAFVVAAGSFGIRSWDALTGKERWAATVEDGAAYAVATGDVQGRPLVVVGSTGGTVWRFDAATGAPAGPPLGRGAVVRAVAVGRDPTGRERLVAGRGDGTVEQWRLDDGSPTAAVIAVGAEVNAVDTVAHDGRLLIATADSAGSARLWDADTGAVVGEECRHDDEIRAVALTHASGGLLLATGSYDGRAVVWDPFTGQPSTEPMPHPHAVLDVAFGVVDGRLMLATACADSNARLWDPVRPSAARVAVSGRVRHTAMGETARGFLLAGAGEDGRVLVWDGHDSGQLATFRLPGPASVQTKMAAVAVADVALGALHGRPVVVASTGAVAQVWDVADGEVLGAHRWDAAAWRPACVAVEGGSALVAHVTDGGGTEVADVVTGQTRFTFGDGERVRALRFHNGPAGSVLAVVRDHVVELLDAVTGLPRWPAVPVVTHDVALGRIGGTEVVAYWRTDGVGLWDPEAGQPFGPRVSHSGAQGRLAIVRVDGRDVLLTAHSATVRVWNPRTGRLVSELPFGTSIDSVTTGRDVAGRTLVAVSGPGVVVAELVTSGTHDA